MKRWIFALRVSLAVAFGGLSACSTERPAATERASLAQGVQAATWQPSPGHRQVPIWPGAVPDAQPPAGAEEMVLKGADVPAYKPGVEMVDNVSQPTMTVYAPKGKNTGVAVVVFPGGGYQVLAMDLEGTEICDWLTSRGITAVLLKYRVPIKRVGPYWESLQALQDAQRTLGLVRFHAAEWHIDPHKIGVIGFSAGGHMVAATSTRYRERSYPAVDAADTVSCRPDFAMALYPGHLWVEDPEDDKEEVRLNPDVPVDGNTPPTFIVQATNDPVDSINNSVVYYLALKKAKVAVEMHLYAEGGHGFGLRRKGLPITEWPGLAERWMGTIGMISK